MASAHLHLLFLLRYYVQILIACTHRMFFVFSYLSISFDLTILIEWIPHSEIADREYVPNAYFQGQGIWITVTNLDNGCNKKLPRLYSVYSLGCLYTTSCYMVQYQPVDTDKLRSISLANNDHSLLDSDTSKNDNDSSCISTGGIINGLKSNNKSAKQLQKKSNNNNHDSNNHKSYNYTNTDLEYIVAQINAGQDLFVTVENYLNKNHGGQQNVRKSYSWSPKYEVIKIFLIPIIFIAWIWFIFIHYLKKIIDYRFLNLSNIFYSYWHTGNNIWCSAAGNKKSLASVKNGLIGCQGQGQGQVQQNTSISENFFVFYCLSEKIQIMEDVLIQCGDFVRSWQLPSQYRQRLWISINSHIVVLLIDVTVGIAVGQVMYKHSGDIVSFLTEFSIFLHSDILKNTIESYRHSPMGIKLNPLITKKIGYVLKLLLREFSKAISLTSSLHDIMVKVIGCSGAVGVTVQLSLIIDLTRIMTMHIMIIHRISSILFIFQCNLILTLFHLFKGQKVNILRKRVDTCECDRIQLLFGVVLFSMVFFLFPSFAAYFFLFSFTQGLVLLTQVALWSAVVFVRDFPYYSLATSCYEPLCFTRGLKFHLIETSKISTSSHDSSPAIEIGYMGQSCQDNDENKKKFTYIQDGFYNLLSSPFRGNLPTADENNSRDIISPKSINVSDACHNDVDSSTEDSALLGEYSYQNNLSPRLTNNVGSELQQQEEDKNEESLPKNLRLSNEKSNDRQQRLDLAEVMGTRDISRRGNLNVECPETRASIWSDTECASPHSPSTRTSGRSPNSLSVIVTPKQKMGTEISNPYIHDPNSLTQTLRLREEYRKRRNQTSRFHSPGSSRTSRIYLLLAARPLLAISFFPKYFDYLSCFCSRSGLFMYFFKGMLWGSPALDLQHIKKILQISQNGQRRDCHSYDGINSSSSRNSFYEILQVVFEYHQTKDARDVNSSSPLLPNPAFSDENENESNLSGYGRSHSNQDYRSDEDAECNSKRKLNQNDADDRRSQRNSQEDLFIEPKIHKRLNRTLFIFVLVTYVICLISYIGGFTFFVYSLSTTQSHFFNLYKTRIKE